MEKVQAQLVEINLRGNEYSFYCEDQDTADKFLFSLEATVSPDRILVIKNCWKMVDPAKVEIFDMDKLMDLLYKRILDL